MTVYKGLCSSDPMCWAELLFFLKILNTITDINFKLFAWGQKLEDVFSWFYVAVTRFSFRSRNSERHLKAPKSGSPVSHAVKYKSCFPWKYGDPLSFTWRGCDVRSCWCACWNQSGEQVILFLREHLLFALLWRQMDCGISSGRDKPQREDKSSSSNACGLDINAFLYRPETWSISLLSQVN